MKTHVLIVEDEVTLAKNIDRFLSRQGYATTIVSTVLGALSVVRNQPIDIVLLDIELADGNGLEAYPQLCHSIPNLQGIAMTGRPQTKYQERAQQLQLHGFLVKPFPLALLAEQVQALSLRCKQIRECSSTHRLTPLALSLLTSLGYAMQ